MKRFPVCLAATIAMLARISFGQCVGWDQNFGLPGADKEVRVAFSYGGSPGAPDLYIGGTFDLVCGLEAHGFAKWDGTTWMQAAGGVGNGHVDAMAVWDDGTGPALYVGGSFSSIGA